MPNLERLLQGFIRPFHFLSLLQANSGPHVYITIVAGQTVIWPWSTLAEDHYRMYWSMPFAFWTGYAPKDGKDLQLHLNALQEKGLNVRWIGPDGKETAAPFPTT